MRFTRFLMAGSLILFLFTVCRAQQFATAPGISTGEGAASNDRIPRLDYLRKRRDALQSYLSTVPVNSRDHRAAEQAISEIDREIRGPAGTSDSVPAYSSPAPQANACNTAPMVPGKPFVCLSTPADGRPDVSTTPTFSWTEDQQTGVKNYSLTGFVLEISRDKSFRTGVVSQNVTPATPNAAHGQTTFSVPDSAPLEPGTTYYWRVKSVYTYTPPGSSTTTTGEEMAVNAPYYFITAIAPFAALEKHNFHLQRTVDSTDPTEGAQFSFLKTFGKGTVFSTDFAFFYDSHPHRFSHSRGHIWFRPAVEGSLTSDESAAEDAWRFSGSAIVDYNFIDVEANEYGQPIPNPHVIKVSRPLIDGLYFEFGGGLEASQDFNTRKLISRAMVTPSSRRLAIGFATGRPGSHFQFMWRPSFELNAGHTFQSGNSSETGATVFRLFPRLRATLYTRDLSRALKIANSYFYVDETFYYLPVDDFKKRHNFFVSGFELDLIKNFGFGLTYKNGEAAPKFTRVNTFGGVLTVRFGRD